MKTLGWETRLIEYLSKCSTSSFEPGKLDCAMFCAGAIEAMTGENPGKGFNYKRLATGYKQLGDRGFVDHVEYVASIFEELPSVLMAQRGDMVAIPGDDDHPVLGIVQGEQVYVMGLNGLGLVPLDLAVRAFRV